MKILFTSASLMFLVLFISGCSRRLPPLGYVTIQPYAKPFQKKINEPLNVILMDDVKDSLIVQGGGIKNLRVSSFRKSVQDGLTSTFGKNFETVRFPEKNPEKGLVLVIYRIRPFWKVGRVSNSTVITETVAIPVTTNNSSTTFDFESSLFLDNKKIQMADGQASSNELTSSAKAHNVFTDGLQITCETINRMTFTDEIIAKVN